MDSKTPYLARCIASLPSDFAPKVQALCLSNSAEIVLDTLIRFISGAECSVDASSDTIQEWSAKQRVAKESLNDLIQATPNGNKRQREQDELDEHATKRQKIPSAESADDPPVFTLHAISTTSPIRKKSDITIHRSSIKFTNPSTQLVDANIPLSSITRAFIVPTRGKQKAHWTVVLLTSDMPDRGKTSNANTNGNIQIIFGVDAVAANNTKTTLYGGPTTVPTVISKGSETISMLRTFLSFLPPHALPILEPTTDVFRSAVGSGSNGGVPGIEAYLAAKPGNLWFMKEGILWGEGKPCEFWAVDDLLGKNEGVKLVSATGRNCSVFLTRKIPLEDNAGGDDDDEGIETEFAMVDGKEQPGINQWVRQHRHLFGKKATSLENGKEAEAENGKGNGKGKGKEKATTVPSGPITINQLADDSDDEDSDFKSDSEDLDGSSSSDDSSDEGEGGDEGAAEASGAEEEDEEEEELLEKNHPLMRPGAMPRMSKAAMNMVVGMMEDNVAGALGGGEEPEDEAGSDEEVEEETMLVPPQRIGEGDSDEEDELDD